MSLFSELKRRSVFRVGAAYMVVAWLLMQVTDLAAPALRLPDWVLSFVVFVLLLGFPVALLLAWAYELTPEGVRKTQAQSAGKTTSPGTGRKLDLLVVVLVTLAVSVLLFERFSDWDPWDAETVTTASQATGGNPSIAVLPFVNMSSDEEQEHFADGLTEEILNSLVVLRDLDVVSRTSSFAFKDSDLPAPEIAGRLGVDYVLEGSVRRVANDIRVTVQLIEAGNDVHVLSRTFDRELTVDNVLGIQEEIAIAVSRTLNARLTPGEMARMSASRPANLEALDRYHDGLYYLRRVELGDFEPDDPAIFYDAVEALEASIEADPEWAPSHAALGRVHHFFVHLDPERQLALSRQHLDEAVRIDPEYGPAYASLGYVNWYEGDYERSLAFYETAADLGAASNWGRAILFLTLGQLDDAVRQYRQAAAWDPLSFPVRVQLLDALLCAGQYGEGIRVGEEVMRMRPDEPYPKADLAVALARTGDKEAALRIADEVAAVVGTDSIVADTLALVGEEERAKAAIDDAETAGRWLAQKIPAALVLGDTDGAIDLLTQAQESGSISKGTLGCWPEVRELEGHPRYQALIERFDGPE